MAMMRQNTAYTRLFLMVLSSDHVSPATGKTVTVNLSKAGGAFAAAGGVVTEVSAGWYKIALTTTDTNTIGDLVFDCTATGCDNTDFADQVVAVDFTDAVHFGLSALPNMAAAANGGLPTVDAANGVKVSVGTATGQINASAGKVPATLASTDVTGNVASDVQTIKTQAVTCAAPVTVEPFVGTATAALVVNGSGFVTVATNNDKTGYSLTQTFPTNFSALGISATGHISNVDNLVANSDKTGYSLTQAFPANFSSLAITLGGAVTVGTNNDKTGYSLTQSFPANFAALGISVGGHISNVDTLTTYTGDTPQTGDSFARLGAPAGASVSADIAACSHPATAQTINLTTAIPTTGNTANTIADCLNAARGQAFGAWKIVGTTLTLYAPDGTTAIKTFTLDSSTAPTQRT